MHYFVKKSEESLIEPEEILLDKISADKLDDSKMEVPIRARNFKVFFVFVIFIFTIFFARSVDFQIFKHESYAMLAEKNKTRSYPILAKRGVVYDRNSTQLVENIPSFDLVAIPVHLPRSSAELGREVEELARQFSLNKDEILQKLQKNTIRKSDPILIKENISRDEALFIEARINEFQGIELQKNATRNYQDGEYFAHILGYAGKVSEIDLKENNNLSSIDYIGKSGVEYVYDALLRGENGRMIQDIDSVLRITKERKVKDDISGYNLILTIDVELQKKVYDELLKQIQNTPGARGAAAVALNPKTGEVLALVSAPSYDNNIFSTTKLKEEYSNLLKNPKEPLFNRAISGTYPPGSSIKPFMASAGLEDGVITKNTKINDIGYISIVNQYNKDIVYTFKDWKEGGHGIVDVKKALAVSSNVFFYTVGGGHNEIKGLGIRKMKKYLNFFGYGSLTGIDLPGEKEGLIPDPEWKTSEKGEDWYTGDTYNSAIGQGNVSVTPLQLAAATASIANGGKLLKPYILQKVIDKDQSIIYSSASQITRENFIQQENLKTVREGMRMAVMEGSARRLADLPVKIAGKTGTAQNSGNNTHAWFTSFAPYDDPEIVLTILVETGGEGSGVAVPAAKEIYKHFFKIDNPIEEEKVEISPEDIIHD